MKKYTLIILSLLISQNIFSQKTQSTPLEQPFFILINGTTGAGRKTLAETLINNTHGIVVHPGDYNLISKLTHEQRTIIIPTCCTDSNLIKHYISLMPANYRHLVVLAYCPLSILPYHLLDYNLDHEPRKNMITALEEFELLYQGQSINSYAVIGSLNRRDMNIVFSGRDFRLFPGLTPEYADQTMMLLEKFFHQQFPLNYFDECYLRPRIQHDIVVNTGINSPIECTNQILGLLYQPIRSLNRDSQLIIEHAQPPSHQPKRSNQFIG